MVLYKLEDFDPDYRDTFGGDDIKGYDVYAERNDEKIGSVKNILVDESGHFRYLVVDTGFWIFGKQVLLPVGRSSIDHNARRIYALGFTEEQARNLPEFNDNLRIDYDYEEQVRGVYRTPVTETPLETSVPVGVSAPVEASAPLDSTPAYAGSVPSTSSNQPRHTDYNPDTYTYQQEPSLYEMNQRDHQTLKLYEERLIANKNRVKTGEVTVGKKVETETARVAIPVEKERVIIERLTPEHAGTVVSPGTDAFQEGEVAHMEIYEEKADIQKKTFVREEVNVRKEVEQDRVNTSEQLRREELDVDTAGLPVRNEKV
ncbi:MAG TPA: photosystem reaction center subunit H [Cyanobacteria bacterium UBA8803]|nr:photosystem reaction center subunit H [Cyanobacteria bacterium UBA9273]HBL59745.1 photosystem reaction center subunit H [Cyanobacteria bacterium UBA8803]